MQKELDRIAGAQEALGLLCEKFELEVMEAAEIPAREAWDTALAHVAALQAEYRHRRATLHPHHETRLFLLTGEDALPIDHDRYVALAEGKATAPEFVGCRLRLADWYVRMEGAAPGEVVNETYGWLVFNAEGRLDLRAAHAITDEVLPGEAEKVRIQALLFGAAA